MDAAEAVFHYIDEYSRMAEAYDANVRPRFEPVARRLVDTLDPRPGEPVLEIAAGTGNATLLIAPRVLPGGSVTAIDAANGQLEVARRRASESGISNVRFEMMDATSLAYPRHAFAAAVSSFGIPIARWREAFSEAHRVLGEGGRFVFSEWEGTMAWATAFSEAQKPHRTSTPSARLAQLREAVLLLRGSKDREELGDAGAVRLALERSGFSEVRVLRETFHPRFEDLDALLRFRHSWGYDEMEWREMGADARAAFRADLEKRVGALGGPGGLVFNVFFVSARRA